jgi:hypothetical protein
MTTAAQITTNHIMRDYEREIADNCHIYFICKIPSLAFDKDTFIYENEHIKGNLIFKINGEVNKIPFESHLPLLDGASKIELAKYPHREVHSKDTNNEIIRYLPATAVFFGHSILKIG